MFGSREIALGAVTLVSSGAARRNLVAIGVAVDAADVVAGIAAGANKSVSKSTSVMLTLPALGAVAAGVATLLAKDRSEEHTSELQSLMRISYAVFCLKKKKNQKTETTLNTQ